MAADPYEGYTQQQLRLALRPELEKYLHDKKGPEEAARVEKYLDKYVGQEKEMLIKLTSSKRSTSGNSSGMSSLANTPRTDPEAERLHKYYQHYGQNKSQAECAEAVTRFREKGKLDDMWAKLTAKYGPEPGGASSEASKPSTAASKNDPEVERLHKYYKHYGQEKSQTECAGAVAKYREAGKLDDMWSKLTAKYGPEPGDAVSESSKPTSASKNDPEVERLQKFYQHYGLDKSQTECAEAVAKFREAGKLDTMWSKLTAKYGPEPDAAATKTSQASTVSDPEVERLYKYYKHYGHDKSVTECAEAVTRFREKGKLDDMWAKLTAKYGPEPGGASSEASKPTSTPKNDPEVERLQKFYQHYGLDKSQTECEQAVAKFREAGKLDTMWSKLTAKYGPEPDASAAISASPVQQDAENQAVSRGAALEEENPPRPPTTEATTPGGADNDGTTSDTATASPVVGTTTAPADESKDNNTNNSNNDNNTLLSQYITTVKKSDSASSSASAPPAVPSGPPPLSPVVMSQPQQHSNGSNTYGVPDQNQNEEGGEGGGYDTTYDDDDGRGGDDYYGEDEDEEGVRPRAALPANDPLFPSVTWDRNQHKPSNNSDYYDSINKREGSPKTGSPTSRGIYKSGSGSHTSANNNNSNLTPSGSANRFSAGWSGGGGTPTATPKLNSSNNDDNKDVFNRDKYSFNYLKTHLQQKEQQHQRERQQQQQQQQRSTTTPTTAATPTKNSTPTYKGGFFSSVDTLSNAAARSKQRSDHQSHSETAAAGVAAAQSEVGSARDSTASASASAASGGGGGGGGGGGPPPHSAVLSHRERVMRLFELYQPDKVIKVVHTTTTQPGPAAPNPTTAPPAAGPVEETNEEKLRRYFQHCMPDKVGSERPYLAKYVGKEAALFRALEQKYGPPPPPTGGQKKKKAPDYLARLRRYFTANMPQALGKEEQYLAQYAGKEEPFFRKLAETYGPEPEYTDDDDGASANDNNPTNSNINITTSKEERDFTLVDACLEKYAGREEEFITALIQKWGPEPPLKPEDYDSGYTSYGAAQPRSDDNNAATEPTTHHQYNDNNANKALRTERVAHDLPLPSGGLLEELLNAPPPSFVPKLKTVLGSAAAGSGSSGTGISTIKDRSQQQQATGADAALLFSETGRQWIEVQNRILSRDTVSIPTFNTRDYKSKSKNGHTSPEDVSNASAADNATNNSQRESRLIELDLDDGLALGGGPSGRRVAIQPPQKSDEYATYLDLRQQSQIQIKGRHHHTNNVTDLGAPPSTTLLLGHGGGDEQWNNTGRSSSTPTHHPAVTDVQQQQQPFANSAYNHQTPTATAQPTNTNTAKQQQIIVGTSGGGTRFSTPSITIQTNPHVLGAAGLRHRGATATTTGSRNNSSRSNTMIETIGTSSKAAMLSLQRNAVLLDYGDKERERESEVGRQQRVRAEVERLRRYCEFYNVPHVIHQLIAKYHDDEAADVYSRQREVDANPQERLNQIYSNNTSNSNNRSGYYGHYGSGGDGPPGSEQQQQSSQSEQPPPQQLSHRERLIKMFELYAPDKIEKRVTVGGGGDDGHDGGEEEADDDDDDESEDQDDSMSYENRIIRILQYSMPEKGASIPSIARALIKKEEGREDKLIRALLKKYMNDGPEPPAPEKSNKPKKAKPTTNHHQPQQTIIEKDYTMIDAYLTKYSGREEEFFTALVQKWGPEPAPPPQSSHVTNVPQSNNNRSATTATSAPRSNHPPITSNNKTKTLSDIIHHKLYGGGSRSGSGTALDLYWEWLTARHGPEPDGNGNSSRSTASTSTGYNSYASHTPHQLISSYQPRQQEQQQRALGGAGGGASIQRSTAAGGRSVDVTPADMARMNAMLEDLDIMAAAPPPPGTMLGKTSYDKHANKPAIAVGAPWGANKVHARPTSSTTATNSGVTPARRVTIGSRYHNNAPSNDIKHRTMGTQRAADIDWFMYDCW